MKKFLVLCLLLFPLLLSASPELLFDGYLSPEKVDELKGKVEAFSHEPPQELCLLVRSQSGALVPVLELAKMLYALREEHKTRLVVYINDEALGASAIIPFLADELYITPNVAWGAIVSNTAQELPTNVLRSRIQGLVLQDHPQAALLNTLASAMCDFDLELATEISKKKGETLVINQNVIKELHLVKATLTPQEFYTRFLIKEEKQAEKPPVLSAAETFEQLLERHIHFPPNETPHLGYISLVDRQEAIGQPTWIYITTALNAYKKSRPSAIILEINSPGGEVFAAERISDALKEIDTQDGIPVICYINNWAISAGAMLAYSCRYIVVAKDASMGAAEPITVGASGTPETASEKINSALRTDFANRAKFFGRNPYIAEAMVDKDIILVSRHGEILKVDAEEQVRKGGIDPDIIIKPKGKLLTLNADQLIQYGQANFMLQPKKLLPLTDKERETGVYPIAKSAIGDIAYFKNVPNLEIQLFRLNWQTRFLALLASPAVSSLLFTIMLIAFYMEISAGGFGMAGAVALISLFLILLSSYALEAVHWLEPILIFFGLLLVGLEVFLFPTLGILGLVGGIFLIMGMAGIMLPGIESVSYQGDALNAAGEFVLTRLAWLSGAFLVAVVVIAILSRYMWPKLALFQRLVLTESKRSEAAVVGTLAPSPLTDLPPLGAEAVVSRTLRPAGKIVVAGEEFDAVSTGNFIQEGVKVRVLRIEGAKVIVEEMYS